MSKNYLYRAAFTFSAAALGASLFNSFQSGFVVGFFNIGLIFFCASMSAILDN